VNGGNIRIKDITPSYYVLVRTHIKTRRVPVALFRKQSADPDNRG